MIGLSDLFHPRDEDTAKAIVAWWERRRLIYNILLAPYTFLVVLTMFLRAGGYDLTIIRVSAPLMFLVSAVFVVPANLWYIGGWLTELCAVKILRFAGRRTGPVLMMAGLVFSALFVPVVLIFFFPIG